MAPGATPGRGRPHPFGRSVLATIWGDLAVVAADGRVQGFVDTPPDLELFEIGADYILGTTTDELGVERVQLWSLDRTPG